MQDSLETEWQQRAADAQRIASLTRQDEENSIKIAAMTAATSDLHSRLERMESDHRAELQGLQRELETSQQRITQLQSHENTLQEQVETLEISRGALMQKADAAARVLATLHSQVASLDHAAQKVAALQSHLDDIESAWVEADQELSRIEQADPRAADVAMEQRHAMSARLDALNRERDEAVNTMRESAERLRVLSEGASLNPLITEPAPVGRPGDLNGSRHRNAAGWLIGFGIAIIAIAAFWIGAMR